MRSNIREFIVVLNHGSHLSRSKFIVVVDFCADKSGGVAQKDVGK